MKKMFVVISTYLKSLEEINEKIDRKENVEVENEIE